MSLKALLLVSVVAVVMGCAEVPPPEPSRAAPPFQTSGTTQAVPFMAGQLGLPREASGPRGAATRVGGARRKWKQEGSDVIDEGDLDMAGDP